MQVLPIYTTSLFFRSCSLALVTAYLGPLVCLLLAVDIIILVIVAASLGFEKKDIFFLACTNNCIMSIGPLKAANTMAQSR